MHAIDDADCCASRFMVEADKLIRSCLADADEEINARARVGVLRLGLAM